ncbi:hypothetical protein LWI29_016344 [Acer saccharum]|uniref:Uncharacterized protein n=1 Tax=Acer saccharum TaxID=4024 RepID=A0AA39S958_ACESA|nr:hypothetical protein LWI29_016344 [Acer saccharum]
MWSSFAMANGQFSSRCEIDNIVSDIKNALSIAHVSSISHVPRDCNKVAHVSFWFLPRTFQSDLLSLLMGILVEALCTVLRVQSGSI